ASLRSEERRRGRRQRARAAGGRSHRAGVAVNRRRSIAFWIRGAAVACALVAGGCHRSGEVLRPIAGSAPVVLQLTDVRVAAGWGHACAVSSGRMVCWGDDADGRLGVAISDGGPPPAPVGGGGGPG